MKQVGGELCMKIVVISHGDFAKGIVNSAQMLAGEQQNLAAYGLYPKEDRSVLEKRLERELQAAGEAGDEVLVLSDIFHGSPFNAAVELMRSYDFYHITGINLPLLVVALLEASMDSSAAEVCDKLMEEFPGTVQDARKLLMKENECEDLEDEAL